MPSHATPDTTPAIVAPPRVTSVEEALEFDTVYEQHFSFVWRNVRRLGVPCESVDDAVQDVFLVVHRRLAEFEGRSSVRCWLYGILANVVRDARRKTRRKDPRARGQEVPDVEDIVDVRGPTPQECAEHADAVRVLYDLLEQLEWQKREVFILVELEQMSIPEAAQALGVNTNTVYSRLRTARQAFNESVARYRAREQRRVG
jgi:RNA polymerase sigma-70 factor (ECF subfamily)